jgi:hypothetical protein
MNNALSMEELEMESAELLPGRETLCVTSWIPGLSQSGLGNSQQGGLVNVAAANGSFNNVLNNNLNNSLNGNNVNVLGVQVVGPTALLGDATSAIS